MGKVSFSYREGISLFSKFENWWRRRKEGYNYISSQLFPPPVYPYSIGFTLTWTCVQYCIGVQYSLGVYQYYIERVIKGGLLGDWGDSWSKGGDCVCDPNEH